MEIWTNSNSIIPKLLAENLIETTMSKYNAISEAFLPMKTI